MILLNKKIDYALLILCYLHHKKHGGCAREIAEHFAISRPFAANILKELSHKGFVRSHRGIKGGYFLTQSAHEATLAQLLDSLDDRVQLVECNQALSEECCSLASTCPMRGPLEDVHFRLRAVLEGVKLSELFNKSAPPNDSTIPLGTERC